MSLPVHLQSIHLPFGDQRTGRFYGKDILSVSQFCRDDLEYIFGVAETMRTMVAHIGTFDLLKGKILANLFYEPSTRTSSSFAAAMERLGGSVIQINEVKFSSVSKGEVAARHHPHAGKLLRRHCAAPPGNRLGRHCGQVRPQADHQRRRRHRRAPHPGAARPVHHPRGAGHHRRPDRHHARRPEVRPHRALAGPPAVAV